MNNWTFPTQIYSGQDSLNRLTQFKNESILIICDPFLKDSPSLNEVTRLLAGNTIHVYTDVIPDPPIDHVVKGIDFLVSVRPTVVIAIGGGSAMDMSKGVAYFGRKLKGVAIKSFIAIPTTSGTGSEVTSFAVITDSETHVKYPLVDDEVLPQEALLTPLFVRTSPPSVTAYSGMDVLVHALEAYVATAANNFTDALAQQAIELVFTNLHKCYLPSATEEEKMNMHEASCLAGLAFNRAGLGIVHAMAHQLGGQFHVPHGLANSMLLPHVILFNSHHHRPTLEKYAHLSAKLGFASHRSTNEDKLSALVEGIIKLERQLDCPTTLSAFGVERSAASSALETMAERAEQDMCYQFNPYKANREELIGLYRKIV